MCCDLGCASTCVSKYGKSEAEQRERCGFGYGVALNDLFATHDRGDKQVFQRNDSAGRHGFSQVDAHERRIGPLEF